MNMKNYAVEHTVTFRLAHAAGSPAEQEFLNAAAELEAIPGVQDFQIRKQTNPKNTHSYGISMRFASHDDYTAYSEHPSHVDFVQQRWLKEVADFQEADFEPL
ncbi:Stress responsive A/B Barrel Domain protein [Roseimaritima multifibrata]|uniref:Stress responsive A/B Barrel Domain protein n=1 Tax=Roseimaritima multifibrata TaxID=1930274 RepID=A0A517MHC3_9BACT|nr:Dabb family protein [Roseimaritima multifibrata]QDS94278.1 Stress responsive A/B Barrel Domain protein [Roseimaritima multifibrata]